MSTTQIDDSDPSVIHTGTWVKGGTAHEFKSTTSSSTTPGDTLTVPFTGTSIQVLATLDDSSLGVQSTYSIDGSDPDLVTSPAGSGDTYKQLVWKSPALAPGAHKLVITMKKVNNAGDGEGTIWFDEFVVTHGAGTTAAAAASNTPATSAALATSSATTAVASKPPATSSGATKHQTAKGADSSASSTPSPSASAAPAAAKSNNAGAIVAAVLVTLFLILALVGFFLFWRNRKKRRLEKLALIGEKPGFDYTGPAPVPYNSAPAGPATPQSAYPFLTNAIGSNSNAPFNPYSAESINPPPPSLPPIGTTTSNYAPSTTTVTSPTANTIPRRESVGSTAAFSSIGNFMMVGSAVPSERAPSPSIAGGSSISYAGGGRVLPSNYGDSAVELKQRAKAAILAEQTQLQHQYPIQHLDSGMRGYGIANPGEEQLPMELPPVYSAN